MKTDFLKFLSPLLLLIFCWLAIKSCEKRLDKKDCRNKGKYVYESLVMDRNCNCIVAGKVKYLYECKTAVIVDYGNGACDNIVTKTICFDGICETNAGAYSVDFVIDCSEEFTEGPISEDEASFIGF